MEPKVFVVLAVVICGIAGVVLKFHNQTTETKKANVKEFLKYAVAQAEKALGAGTGQLKLRYVYNMTVERFPWVASLITFDVFSSWVDESLDWLENQLHSNDSIQKYVED